MHTGGATIPGESQLVPDHPIIAASLASLAAPAPSEGRYAEAEPLYLRALAIRESQLGPDHPDTAASLNNLAALLNAQGKYAEAAPLSGRALCIRESKLGPNHPASAVSLDNLAGLLQAQGKYAEAEPLFKRALSICESTLGPDRPGAAARPQQPCRSAQALARQPRGSRTAIPAGVEHRWSRNSARTIPLLRWCSTTSQDCSKPRASTRRRSCSSSGATINESALGPDHPSTATTLNNVASLLQARGKYVEAEPLYERARRIQESAAPVPTIPTLRRALTTSPDCSAFRAGTLRRSRSYGRAWDILERVLGPDSKIANQVLINYLIALRVNGRSTEYRSALSNVEPKRAGLARRQVDAAIKADRKRRGL